MNDAHEGNVESAPKSHRAQRLRGWVGGHPRLRFAILGALALVVIAGTWTGVSLNATSAAAPAAATSTSSDTPSSKSPSAAPESTKSPEDKTTKKPEKPQKPQPKPEGEATEDDAPAAPAAGCGGKSGNELVACNMLDDHGFGSGQMTCLSSLWDHESGWNHKASNPSSGAYGIPQALPGNKMAAAGSDWNSNPATQIEWGLGYIKDRYQDPCGAWGFWQANNYY